MSVAAIIVAAGRGRRLGGETPKQYIPLAGRCALRRSVEAFLAVDAIRAVLPVIHDDDRDLCGHALADLHDPRVMPAVPGGATRALSVCEGLEALAPQRPAGVLIHDAARPFVPPSVIEGVIAALARSDGACAALPVVDAVWRSERGMAAEPVPREGLWRAQTPQGFAFDAILTAHRTHGGGGVDDVAVAREAGIGVTLVPGSERNYKITTAADLQQAMRDVQALDEPGGRMLRDDRQRKASN